MLIGRQHSGVRHSSGAESINAGMKTVTAWDDRSIAQKYEPMLSSCEEDFKYTARVNTLAETERLFDELTQEKQQAKIVFIVNLLQNVIVLWEVRGVAVYLCHARLKFMHNFSCYPRNVPLSFPSHTPVLFCLYSH